MALRFYYLSGSPFSWKIWLALERKAIDYEMTVLSVDAGDLKRADYLAINPRGKAPAIVDDGFALYESAAIGEYLEDRFADQGPCLWPQDVVSRAIGRRIAAEVDSYVYPPLRRIVEELLLRRRGEPDEDAISCARDALATELLRAAQSVMGDYMLGVEPSLADFALYPMTAMLGRLDQRHPQRDFGALVPEALKSWGERIETLPYFQKTFPPHWRT